MKVKMTKNEFYVKAINGQLLLLSSYHELVDRIAEILDLEFQKEMPPEPFGSFVTTSDGIIYEHIGARDSKYGYWTSAAGHPGSLSWEQLWESGVTGIYDKRAKL